MKKTLLFFTALSLLWVTTASAKDHLNYLPVPQPVKSLEGIKFVSGGVGSMERKILDRMAGDYSLKVVLATDTGHYLSQVQVEIIRADGTKMVSATTEGPWLLADLEPGSYRVKARYNGKWQSRNITVSPDKQSRLVFNW